MDKKIYINYIYNVLYQLLIILLPLITTPYISRVLQPYGVGIYSYTNSITQYFILFGCIGLNLYSQREIAYHQNNKEKYSIVFFELLLLRIITISISITIYYLSVVRYSKYSFVFLIESIQIIASMFDISWLFQGLEDFKKIVIRNFVVKIIGVFLIFVFVKEITDLNVYIFIQSFILVLGNLSMWFYLPQTINKVNFKKIHIFRHLKPAIILFIPQIATSIYTILDKTMIGLLTSQETEVAFYEQGQKIINMALTIVTSFGTVMMPRIANKFYDGDFAQIKSYMNNTFQLCAIISLPIMFGIAAITPFFVPWFFGDGYTKVIPNMIIISPIIVVIGISNIIGTQYLLPLKRQREFTISVIIGCTINVLLNLLLIPRLLSIGAAFASIIAEISVSITQIIFVKKEFNFINIFKKNFKYCVYSFFMFLIITYTSQYMTVSILSTLIQILIGIIFYLSCLLITKDEIIINILRQFSKGEKK